MNRSDVSRREIKFRALTLRRRKVQSICQCIFTEFCAMADMEEPDCVINLLGSNSAIIIGNIYENPELLKEVV